MKISRFVVIAFVLFRLTVNAQSHYEREIRDASGFYSFNAREIRDSGYRFLLIHRLYSDHIGNENWRDTVYEARFNDKGLVVFEKRTDLILGTAINVHYYDETGRKIKTVHEKQGGVWKTKKITVSYEYDGDTAFRSFYIIETKGKQAVTEEYVKGYNNEGQLLYEKDGDRRTDFVYNNKNQLLISKTVYNDSTVFTSKHNHEKKGSDSIIKSITIEQIGRKIDSVFYVTKYDDRGLRIFESRKPSATYYKTFPTDCTTGDSYEQKYAYDKNGNLLEQDVNFSGEWIVDGKRKEVTVKERDIITKSWLSRASNLLYSIDVSDGGSGNMRTFFEYQK